MTVATVALDIFEPFDVAYHLAPKFALNTILLLHDGTDRLCVILVQIFHAHVSRNAGRFQDCFGTRWTDTENRGQCDLKFFMRWKCYTCDTSHKTCQPGRSRLLSSTLALFMFWILLTNNNNSPFPSNDLAIPTHRFDGCTNLHKRAIIYRLSAPLSNRMG